MQKTKLGRTDIEVTKICLGTMTYGRQNTEQEAHLQMDTALDHGVNFFDTAEMYSAPPSVDSCGKTEEYIGNWFQKTGKRDQVVLASKVIGRGSRIAYVLVLSRTNLIKVTCVAKLHPMWESYWTDIQMP